MSSASPPCSMMCYNRVFRLTQTSQVQECCRQVGSLYYLSFNSARVDKGEKLGVHESLQVCPFFLRQGYSMQPWVPSNLLCRSGWPLTNHRDLPDRRSTCFCLLNDGIRGVRPHCLAQFVPFHWNIICSIKAECDSTCYQLSFVRFEHSFLSETPGTQKCLDFFLQILTCA